MRKPPLLGILAVALLATFAACRNKDAAPAKATIATPAPPGGRTRVASPQTEKDNQASQERSAPKSKWREDSRFLQDFK